MLHRIKCWHCKSVHPTVAHVRQCREWEIEMENAENEIYADNAYVRMMENTGIGTDPRDLYDAW